MPSRELLATEQIPQQGRLIISSPGEGGWNMALDQALLNQVQEDGVPVLRFYQWSAPTLSLGYFQNLSDREQHASSKHLPVVRRSTGGGAIVHDQELTYSLCLPLSNRFSSKLTEIYGAAHDAIIAATTDLGVKLARFADLPGPANKSSTVAEPDSFNKSTGDPFLCFQRRTADDLVISGYKLVGSAQRRSARALLQHGSILLKASPCAAELPGLLELTAKPIACELLTFRLTQWLADALKVDWVSEVVHRDTLQKAKEILESRFLTRTWTERRP